MCGTSALSLSLRLNTMKVAIFTGSRDLPYDPSIKATLEKVLAEERRIFVGCCPTGLDAFVRKLAKELQTEATVRTGLQKIFPRRMTVFRARWEVHGPPAGPLRNQRMIDAALMEPEGDVVVYAWPKGESRGTYDCIRRAVRVGFPVHEMTGGLHVDKLKR